MFASTSRMMRCLPANRYSSPSGNGGSSASSAAGNVASGSDEGYVAFTSATQPGGMSSLHDLASPIANLRPEQIAGAGAWARLLDGRGERLLPRRQLGGVIGLLQRRQPVGRLPVQRQILVRPIAERLDGCSVRVDGCGLLRAGRRGHRDADRGRGQDPLPCVHAEPPRSLCPALNGRVSRSVPARRSTACGSGTPSDVLQQVARVKCRAGHQAHARALAS
jgi:hypothetical protein